MPAERLPMRKVREVLRLKHACGVSERVIARSLGVSRSTVAEYLRRAAVIGLAWPIPNDLDDAALGCCLVVYHPELTLSVSAGSARL